MLDFKIGDKVVCIRTNIDDNPDFENRGIIGQIRFIDKTYPFPYYVLTSSGYGVWAKVRALTLLERELEDV